MSNLSATLPSRPCTTEDGVYHPPEPLEAEYEPHEEEMLRSLKAAADKFPAGSEERSRLLDEMRAIHEMKAMLGGRILSDDEVRERTGEPMATTDALKLMDDVEGRLGVKFPKGARDAVSEGQTTLISPEGTTPLPRAASREELPNPDENRIGKFHGPDSGAPSTERKAAILAYPNSGTARRRVLDHIATSSSGATDEEISLALNMRLYTAAPRRNELLNDGWIRDSGRARPTTTGTQAVVWMLTESGKAKWERGLAT